MAEDEEESPRQRCYNACEEARYTLDHQIEKIHKEDKKAVGVFRINLLIIGLLLSALTITTRSNSPPLGELINAHTVLGTFAIGTSSLIAAMTYTSSEFQMGVGSPVIRDVATGKMTTKEFDEKLGEKYANWIRRNQVVHQYNAYAISYSISLVIVGLLFYSVGTVVGAESMRGSTLSYVLLTIEIISIAPISLAIFSSDWITEHILNMRED